MSQQEGTAVAALAILAAPLLLCLAAVVGSLWPAIGPVLLIAAPLKAAAWWHRSVETSLSGGGDALRLEGA